MTGDKERILFWLSKLKEELFSDNAQKKKNFIELVREWLNDENAFNRNKCYRYKNFGFPDLFIEGFAAALVLIFKLKKEINRIFDHNRSFEDIFGLSFEEVCYKCEWKVGKNFPHTFDAESTTTYYRPLVTRSFETAMFGIITQSDGPIDKYNTSFNIDGDGIDLLGGKASVKEVLYTSVGNKEQTAVVQTIYRFNVHEKYNFQPRTITIVKSGVDMFKIQRKPEFLEQYAGLTIFRPVQKLKLELILPKEVYQNGKIPKVRCIVFETNAMDPYADKTLNSNLVQNPSCAYLGEGRYIWTSDIPPVVGLKYVLSCSTEEIEECLS